MRMTKEQKPRYVTVCRKQGLFSLEQEIRLSCVKDFLKNQISGYVVNEIEIDDNEDRKTVISRYIKLKGSDK